MIPSAAPEPAGAALPTRASLLETPPAAVLMSNADDARQRRLVRTLRRRGHRTAAAAFRRDDYYRAGDADSAEITTIGTLGNESYAARIPVYLRSLARLRRLLADVAVIFAFSSEHVLLARAATALRRPRPVIIREFADVPRTVEGGGLQARFARWIEKRGLRSTSAVLSTSEDFVDVYLRERMDYRGPVAMLPNKPDVVAHPAPEWVPPTAPGRLEILYPGLIRCRRSLEILQAVAAAAPERIAVSVCGHDLTGIRVEPRENVRVLGPFRNPEDLDRIYGGCHVVYAGYPWEPNRLNYRLARTCRLCEAIVYGRPQIAHLGNAGGRFVDEREIGIVVDPADVDAAAARIAAIPTETWRRYARNSRRLAGEWPTYREDFAAAMDQLGLGTLSP